jgi:hypothetical protein
MAKKVYKHLPLQDPPKITQIGIFGSKIGHLATLLGRACISFFAFVVL